MLSGIKTGKRKRPKKAAEGSAAQAPPPAERVVQKSDGNNNRSAADELRQSLLSGSSSTIATNNNSKSADDIQSKLNSRASAYKNNELSINNLQSRGRISDATISKQEADDSIIIKQSGKSSKSNIQYEHETKLRYNSRGKLSNHAHTTLRAKTEKEMSIDDMIKQERSNTNSNMDEVFARNMIKMGKGYNKLDKIMGKVDESGADEEDMLQETSLLVNMYKSNDDKLSPAELASRSKSKQIAQHDAISKWTSKSWWWMESSNFNKQYLISLGEKISLVMTPTHKTLQQDNDVKLGNKWNGGQCYIVPLSYSESFVSLDEDSWYEVQRFQNSLKQMFAKDGRGVIFIETVIRTSKGGGSGMALQAKMEVVPVPKSVERDAPLYFKSGLAEISQEWGTHNKCIVLDGKNKTLRSAVPKSGFPYFYCGWPSDGNNEGYCQLIENEDDGDDYGEDNNDGGYIGGGMRSGGGSKKFPRDFGIDTIGGMMGCDPMRFQRRRPAQDGDRGEILKFLEYWKPFDWTLELDG